MTPQPNRPRLDAKARSEPQGRDRNVQCAIVSTKFSVKVLTVVQILLATALFPERCPPADAFVPVGVRTTTAAAEAECTADGTCKARVPEVPESTSASGTKGGSIDIKAERPPRTFNSADMQCNVYMAPSTLGVDTSMGIYTAVPLEKDALVNFPEIAIPLLFREFGDHVEGYDDGVLWDRYVWEGDVIHVETYIDTNRDASRAVFVPGIGCTVNSVLDMSNILSTHGSNYSTAGLHRSRDAGSGAFTPYHNSQTITVEALPAGAELFASYGDYWIPDIPGAQIALTPLLDEADAFLLHQFYPFVREHDKELTPEMKQALWEFTTQDFPVLSKALSNLPKNSPWSDVQVVLEQRRLEELEATKKHPATANIDENDTPKLTSPVREFIKQQSIRTPTWLRENGYCQDHLKPGLSTIPQAGRGAFASRPLPAGTVLGYAPLVHVGLYGLDIWTVLVGDENNEAQPPFKQFDLIINYSFGHRNSTVLLTPYGGGVNYINHGGKKANVKLRWPDKELIAHKPEFLQRTPFDLSNTVDKIGLSFEYVATRDIAEGEEVLMDYGPEWEAAWAAHLVQWKPVVNASTYVHSSEWTETSFYRTKAEEETNPYPSNLHTMCIESYSLDRDGVTFFWVDVLRTLPFRVYCDVLGRKIVPATTETANQTETMRTYYTVELELDDGVSVIVQDVPHNTIFLYDKAFSADWHLPNVFRHEMAIPDEIMPLAWMNGPPSPSKQ